jgi:hypothetical protein
VKISAASPSSLYWTWDVNARSFNTERLVCKTETYILGGTDLLESLEDLGISKFRVSEDSTSRLNRLNDLV